MYRNSTNQPKFHLMMPSQFSLPLLCGVTVGRIEPALCFKNLVLTVTKLRINTLDGDKLIKAEI